MTENDLRNQLCDFIKQANSIATRDKIYPIRDTVRLRAIDAGIRGVAVHLQHLPPEE